MNKKIEKENILKTAANCITNQKLSLAHKIVIDFLKEYPDDENGKKLFARILRLEGNFEDAIFLLEDIEKKDIFTKKNLILLYIQTEQYDKGYAVLKSLTEEEISAFKENEENVLLRQFKCFFSSLYKDKSLVVDLEPTYGEKQLLNYNRTATLKRIRQSKAENDEWLNFSDDINLELLLNRVENGIDIEKAHMGQSVFASHIIYYPSAGKSKDLECNYLWVVTIANTNKIITMKPVFPSDIFKPYKLEDKTVEKVKRKSRIDSFNEKYKIS